MAIALRDVEHDLLGYDRIPQPGSNPCQPLPNLRTNSFPHLTIKTNRRTHITLQKGAHKASLWQPSFSSAYLLLCLSNSLGISLSL